MFLARGNLTSWCGSNGDNIFKSSSILSSADVSLNYEVTEGLQISTLNIMVDFLGQAECVSSCSQCMGSCSQRMSSRS